MHSPHQQMQKLDIDGQAYHVAQVKLVDGREIEAADVYHHSRKWLCLRPITEKPDEHRHWINFAHVVRLIIVED